MSVPKPKKFKLRRSTLYLRNIRASTKAFFKAWCAKRGKSMREAVEEYMEDCVRKDDKILKPIRRTHASEREPIDELPGPAE